MPNTVTKQFAYRKTPEEYIENLRNFVKEKYNGELLSTEWKGYKKSLYKFRDVSGTEFEQTAENILHKKLWTPNRGLMAEPITRQAVEHIFQAKFPKNTSLLTKKITGLSSNYLELDGYNTDLKIAFEYQGFPSHWDETHLDYQETIDRDNFKKELCKKLGIILIQIPKYSRHDLRHFEDDKILNHIINCIKAEYKKTKMVLPELNTNNFKIDFESLNHGKEKLEEMKKFASENNAILISQEYKGRLHKYKFLDIRTNQEFEITWKSLKQNGYPKRFQVKNPEGKIIAKKVKIIVDIEVNNSQLKKIQALAKQSGYQLVSDKWKGAEHRYVFISENNKYYAINYQWINKFGFPDNSMMDRFQVSSKEASKYLNN
jgi:hypothetical protein